MRKFLALTLALAGALVLGAQSVSALTATAIGPKSAVTSDGGTSAQHVHRRGHRGFGLGFGFYNYPRYRYYNNYDYDRPRYSYYSSNQGRHYCRRHQRWEY